MRAAVYLRISHDRTGEELGVTRQREDAERLVAQRGWTIAQVFTENDTSAAGKTARRAFAALLAGVESGEFDAVVSWSFDRLTRNRRDTVKLIETCQAHATTIAMVRGSDMDMSTPGDRWVADMLAGVARHEIEQKSDRQKRAALQLARSGHPPAGPIPFGFLPDRLTHHPEQSAAIRDAYSSLLAGATLAGVARSWNAAGFYLVGRSRPGHVHGRCPSGAPRLSGLCC